MYITDWLSADQRGFKVVLVIAGLCYVTALAAMLVRREISTSEEHENIHADLATPVNS